MGRVNGELIANPTPAQLEESDIDMVIGASADSVAMVEGEMDEISEAEMVELSNLLTMKLKTTVLFN